MKSIHRTYLWAVGIVILAHLASTQILHAAESAPALPLEEMISRILANYPTVTLAGLELEKSRQELQKVESQLGWVFGAQTGIGHDVSFIDSPSDRFDVGANLGRRYESGIKFDVGGNYSYEDSESSFSPLVPNPSERANLDLKWRIPFGRGKDNPEYSQGKVLAESSFESQKANQIFVVDTLVQQAINIYYDAAETYMRILDAEKAIDRARKLQVFIEKNRKLGLSEKKDILIVQAQVDRLVSARDSLYIAWSRQKAEINRLTGQPAETEFSPSHSYKEIAELHDQPGLLSLIYDRDPQVQLQHSRLKSADANISLARNKKEEQLDVVLSVGARASKGDTTAGTVSQEEWAGRAGLEYQYEIDKRGFDAEIYQALLDQRLAEEQLAKVKQDVAYSTQSLVQQIEDNKNAVQSNKRRLMAEEQKMQDALQRYREGRSDTREVIEFENDLFASSLVYENQRLQLARTYALLNLQLGRIWQLEVLDASQDKIRINKQ